MAPTRRAPDPIRRPELATPTSLIAATWSASISGSDWPTRTGSDRPVLDTLAAIRLAPPVPPRVDSRLPRRCSPAVLGRRRRGSVRRSLERSLIDPIDELVPLAPG